MPVYKREGSSPNEAWNEVIRRVNALIPECPDVQPLPEVGLNHRWAKSDIRAVHDKLKELCDENTFSAIPELWKQSIIDEIVAAIDNGACCCEEQELSDAEGYGGLNSFAVSGSGFQLFFSLKFQGPHYLTLDWAGFARQEVTPPFNEQIPLATGETLDIPSGGPGWFGREFRRWQVFIEPANSGPTTEIIEGPVIDGYIFIGTPAAQTLAREWETALKDERAAIVATASAQAARDTATTPEQIASTQAALDAAQDDEADKTAIREAAESALEGQEAAHTPWVVNSPVAGVWRLDSQGEQAFSQILPTSAFQIDRQFMLTPSIADRPYVIDVFPEFDCVGFIRLLCDE